LNACYFAPPRIWLGAPPVVAAREDEPLSASESDNPLLAYGALPRFDRIEPQHVVPAVRSLLAELGEELDALESALSPGWQSVMEPLARMGDRLGFTWGIVGHLMGVKNSDALREAFESVQSEVVAFGLRQGQSRPIYEALSALRASDDWHTLDEAQQRVVESMLRDARHSGVALEGEARDRFNQIQQELAKLATEFSNHVLDAAKTWSLTLREPAEMEGTPESLRQLAAQAAREAGEEQASAEGGPWRLTLDYPSFIPFMEHARRRDLRERLYRAWITRAGAGELDNGPLIGRILALRREEAELLGYKDFADLSLDGKMAPDVQSVQSLLEDLRRASFDAAARDLDELRTFARETGSDEADDLRHWDLAFWSERLREARFDYSEEALRPYFPLPRVLEGLFDLARRLFGIEIVAADGETPVWHPDVRFFRVRDESRQPIASFFLDPYSRPGEKRGGAWMNECTSRSRLLAPPGEAVRLPVAYLVCNQTPPVDGRPSLMSWDEVNTLFHEFGHGLQHMLTRVDEVMASGIRNIEWDAVELPSQFMENWCYQRETVRAISGHVYTGEPLPDALFAKLEAARTYRAGSDMLRQLYFALTDLALHHGYDPGRDESAFDVQRRIAQTTTVLPPLPEDRFLCSFGHIFAGGYAAGYYSYKWAEVLSADAFAAFEEAGLDDPAAVAATGRRFRDTVLALGGSLAPMEVFRAFRGREPSPDALLRHSGLAGG
jgi:oligopeptidase A